MLDIKKTKPKSKQKNKTNTKQNQLNFKKKQTNPQAYQTLEKKNPTQNRILVLIDVF